MERIAANFIRGDSEPVTFKADLPAEVRRFDYELRPQGQRPSAMLALNLTDRPPGPRGAASVSTSFLPGGADFAVAVGRDYLLGLFRSQLLQGLPPGYTASGTGYSAGIQPDWSAATFDLQPGRMLFSVSGSGSITYGAWPLTLTDHWTFTVRQALTLGVVAGVLEPQLAGDPEVELHDVAVFEATLREKARENIKRELQLALDTPPAGAPHGARRRPSARQAAPRAASRLAGRRADRGRDPAGWRRRRRHRGARPDARHRGQAGGGRTASPMRSTAGSPAARSTGSSGAPSRSRTGS